MKSVLVNAIGLLEAYGMINNLYHGNYFMGIILGGMVLWVASDKFLPPPR
jgi:cytosine/uracil/thiamine/allantoin permease